MRDRGRIFGVFAEFKPDIVFHAAALKHVPLLERDWGEGIKTNVFGSVNVADAASAAGATAMVMISTDKAIEPVSVLGATKRFAEMYCQALDADFARRAHLRPAMRLIAVRFGNVLALERLGGAEVQGADRGGRTGHGHASRHGALLHDDPRGLRPRRHGGEPCARSRQRADALGLRAQHGPAGAHHELGRAHDPALAGCEPGKDIEIEITGVRPGERLHEILFARDEPSAEIGIEGIVAAKPSNPSVESMRGWLATLEQGLARNDRSVIYGVLRDAVPDFGGEAA